MKKFTKLFCIIVLLLSFAVNIYATEGDVKVVDFMLEPVEIPDSPGPAILNYGFTIKDEFCKSCNCCDELEIEIIPKGVGYQGETHIIAKLSDDTLHSFYTTFPIIIPPNDTSSLRVILKIGQSKGATEAYFVTTGELVEFWKGYPSGRYWKYPKYEPDTTKYDVQIDLRVQRRFDYIDMKREFFGPMQPSNDSGFYIIKITRESFNDLIMEGFKCDYIEEPPPVKPGPSGVKSTIHKRGGNPNKSPCSWKTQVE